MKRMRTRVNHKWFTFDVYIDENFRTHAKLIGYTSQTPMKYRTPIHMLITCGLEGVAKIDPRDSFDYRIGTKYAVNRAIQKIQMTILKASAKLDSLWCGVFNMLNDSSS